MDRDLWLLGQAGAAEAASLVPAAGEAVSLTVPEGVVAFLPAGTDTQLWQARAGASLGAATGWAEDSVIASAAQAVPLRSTGRATGADTRMSLMLHTLVAAPGQAVDTATASLVSNDLPSRPDLTPWLASVLVRPEFRGRGYSAPLVRHVEAAAAPIESTLWLYTWTAAPL